MFDSKTLSRGELEERYEQASTILGVLKGILTEEHFNAILAMSAAVYAKLKEDGDDSDQSNLPPGWTVFDAKR